MNNRMDAQTVLAGLQNSLQQQVGSAFEVKNILDMSPVMTEVRLHDSANKQVYDARIYRVTKGQWRDLEQAWKRHGGNLHDPPHNLPQPSYGLKRLGEAVGYVAGEVTGMDLGAYLDLVGPCRAEYAVRLTANLVNLLESLESTELHHHQIRPSQIVLTKDGFAILKHTGLAAFETALAEVLGIRELMDPTYAAPEQLEHGPLTTATDIYQLGVVLFHMVTGRPPFTGDYKQVRDGHLKKGLPNPQALNSEVGVGLTRVLVKALAKNPDHRFQSLEEFKKTLSFMLPPVERGELNGQPPLEDSQFNPSDLAKMRHQLNEANQLLQDRNYQPALQIVDAVLMASGPHHAALGLHKKISDAMNRERIQSHFDEASRHLAQQQPQHALKSLHQLLSLEPHHLQALSVQGRIFDAARRMGPSLHAAIPFKAYLGKAAEAKSQGNQLLAMGLWAQILLAPARDNDPNSGFAKQMAGREWESQSAQPEPPPRPAAPPREPEWKEARVETESATPAAVRPTRPRPNFLKYGLIFGGIAVVAAVLIFLGLKWREKTAYRSAANQAYQAADNLETSGNWEGALQAWAQVVADYPDFEDSESRHRTLEYKIRERQQTLRDYLDTARGLMLQGVLRDDLGEGAVDFLKKVLRTDPDNEEARALLEEIRLGELERARGLWEEKKHLEAMEVYERLIDINPTFGDEGLGTEIAVWTEENILKPGLAKMNRAIQRKRWDEAFEISEELSEKVRDASMITERWNEVFLEYETQYFQAAEKNQEETMLALLEVMTRVRPEDASLMEQKNKLNRDLNLSKIINFEKDINRALDRNDYRSVGSLAKRLQSLDSENKTAENALATVRTRLKNRIASQLETDPRAALDTYGELIGIVNWKSYRTERDQLRNRIENFDKKVNFLKNNQADTYKEWKTALDNLIATSAEFSSDSQYQWLLNEQKLLDRGEQRLQELLKWESGARDDVRQSYQTILDKLNAEKSFRHEYANKTLANMKSAYQARIEDYSGNVTLVIRSATGLPRESSGLNKAPEAFCLLQTAGQSFRTGVVNNNHNPDWGYTCNFKAKPGSPLVFSIFDEEGRKQELLGKVELPKVPKNGKDIVLKSPDGWQLTIDVRRER